MSESTDMAEILDQFPFRSQRSSQPWDQWLDGRIWKLTAGVDFTGALSTFRTRLFTIGKNRGLSVQTKIVSPNEIVIQAKPRTNGDE